MHKPVLLQETIDGLELRAGDVVVDGTLGRGGHSLEMFRREKDIFLIGIDRDEDAIDETSKRFAEEKISGDKYRFFSGNFRDMDGFLAAVGKKADKVLLDLGLSSPQFDTSGRGFSFQKSEPLRMTMEREPKPGAFTAQDIVNTWAEEDIANVIYAYGDERYARRIARAIVGARETGKIEKTDELAEIVYQAVPGIYRRGKIHPATRTFQALRIAVNDELGSLKDGLVKALDSLRPTGRLAVISFHSLEDRIVKNFMRDAEKDGRGRSLFKKPVSPSDAEVRENPRSRSAKLRIFIKN